MRWAPTALVGVCALLWADALAGGALAAGPLALLAVAAVAVVAGLRAPVAPLAAAVAVAAALLTLADRAGAPGRFSLANDAVFYAVVVGVPALAGRLIGSRNLQVAELERRRRELAASGDVAVRAARAQEVQRVEREVDVVLAGRLRSIVEAVRAAHAAEVTRPGGVPALLAVVERDAREALGELRRVLGVLHADHGVAAPAAEVPADASGADAPPVAAPAGRRRRLDGLDLLLVLSAIPLAVETALPGRRGPAGANVALALLQGAALPWVRRRPVAAAGGLMAVAVLQTALLAPLPHTVSWFVPSLLAALLVGLAPARAVALGGLAVLVLGVCAVSLVLPSASRPDPGLLPGLVMGALVWAGGRLAAARAERARQLALLAGELARTRELQARVAADEQRRALARDLHDVGAHALTAVCLQAAAAQTWWERDAGRARTAMDGVRTLTDETLVPLSLSLARLGRPRAGEPLDLATLDELAGLSRLLGLRVDLAVTGRPRPVAGEVAEVAYRVIQEALTNAARHAGGTRVHVGLAYADDALEVRVSDTGRAPGGAGLAVPVRGAGWGLRGMRERVEALRGELTAGPAGAGFEVLARLPA